MPIQPFLAGEQICDANGKPVPGASLTYYLANTTTLQTVYSDRLGANPTTNPVVCDAGGVSPMHFLPDAAYDLLCKDAGGVLIPGRSYYNLNNPAGTIGNANLVMQVLIDYGGAPIPPGFQPPPLVVPYAGALNAWTLLSDTPATLTVDLRRDNFPSYPPTPGDSIVGAAPPALANSNKATSTALTGWQRLFTDGDILQPVVTANDLATKLTISLIGTRS